MGPPRATSTLTLQVVLKAATSLPGVASPITETRTRRLNLQPDALSPFFGYTASFMAT